MIRNNRKGLTALEGVLIIIIIIIGIIAGYYAYQASSRPPPSLPPTPTPGVLKISNLVVQPSRAEAGQPITVSVTASNTGGSNITDTIYLYVNGTVEASKEITVEAGKETTVKFTLTKSEGKYLVSAGSFSKVIEVLPAIKNPDTIIVATIGEPETLDPAWAYDTASGEVIFNVYETLIFFKGNRTDEFIPLLATEWSVSPDGLTYTFKIRNGVKFQNGDVLTPQDVEYSIERALVQDRDGGPTWMLAEPLLGIDVVHDTYNLTDPAVAAKVGHMIDDAVESNATHVIFHLKNTYPPFLGILAQTWASVLDKKWCIAQGDWPGWDPTYTKWVKWNNPDTPPLQEKMMGTGPFMLDRWEHGVQVVLKRFDGYWRGPAEIKTAIIKKVDEWSTRKLMFLSGDADMVYVPRAHIKELEGIPHIRLYKDLPELVVGALFFTFNISPNSPYIGSGKLDGNGIPPNFFSDINVRKAFAYSFDYNKYIEEAFLGEASRAANPIIKGLPYYWPNAPMYEFNLTKAEEYFKKAWNGALWENGFTLTLTYNVGNEARHIAAEILKYNIESLNPKFKIYIRAVEWPTFLRALVGSQLPTFIIGWLADYADPHDFVFPFMHSSGAFSAFQHYSNPQVDKLIEEGITTTNSTKREMIYRKLAVIYYDDVPSVPLYQPLGRHYERDWVKGWYYNPIFPGIYFYTLSKGY